ADCGATTAPGRATRPARFTPPTSARCRCARCARWKATRGPSRSSSRCSTVCAEHREDADLLVARLGTREAPAAQILECLLDLRAGGHHEGAVAGDRLVERARCGQQKAPAARSGGGLDDVAFAEDNQRRGVRGLRTLAESNLALIDVGECRVAPR